MKKLSKSKIYLEFIKERIAPGERASSDIGNMYTASIFMSLLSLLNDSLENGRNIEGQKIGFFSYGSGSKSKVFEATICPAWKNAVAGSRLFDILESRREIDVDTYEKLHRNETSSITTNERVARLQSVGQQAENRGLRKYRFG